MADATIAVCEELLSEGIQTYQSEAARRLELSISALRNRLHSARAHYGLTVDETLFQPKRKPAAFTVDPVPQDGEPDAETLIAELTARHAKRAVHDTATKVQTVRVNVDGPIAVAFFGDPHIDDPGCAWGDLSRDVAICRDTQGFMAVNIGDTTNNWVGRLMGLYANQEVTSKQALKLIEWLLSELPWLITVGGNHDCHDMETEALTGRGWVYGSDIRAEDQILSLDGDGRAVWTGIDQIIQRQNDEPMVSIDSSVISLNVTPNHRVLHRKRSSFDGEFGPLEYRRADSLPHRFALPVSAPSGNNEYPLSDDWIALTGWFLTDGGVSWTKNSPRVSFYQSKPAADLEALFLGCGLSPAESTRQRNIASICGVALKKATRPSREYRLSAEQGRQAMTVFEAKGICPSWVDKLSDRQFGVFLNAVIAGDGSWASNGFGRAAVVHGTKAFLDSLQAACVRHGWCAHLSVAREKDWRLNVSTRREYQAERTATVKRSEPVPRVWCLRVPHGNFMVRRHGKAHFSGNSWNTQKGDVSEVIHKLQKLPGLYENVGARMRVVLPGDVEFTMNCRHDFPGGSQFNPAHALVRETLFGFRDHILACGHRHHSGYIPVWHNDPRRLCHGFRVGTYKDFDHYAREKGFKEANWARSMAAVIDPAYAEDPVRFIKPFFNLEEAAEYLTWKRGRFDVSRST